MTGRNETSPFVWERHTFAGKRWPRSRVARSFLMLTPWLNLMALAVLLWMLAQATLVQPGRTMTLAHASLAEGLPATLPTAMLRWVESPGSGGATVLFLEDEGRFSADRPEELAKLGEALEQTLGEARALNLLIDAAVSHGETMRWLERLQACGVGTVNLVATPEEAEADVPAAEH